ncbi:MAG: RNA 2',3'-cyclic phosphodiesterase [Anaerolineae bacterium]|nr:RNA 2',3'-cyclic phosphodiesterase [Anaerolineae bacterium]
MSESQLLRTFVALPLSSEVLARVADIQRGLQRRCPEYSVKWVKPESIHLTLFFLGEITQARVEPVKAAMAAVARNVAPFTFDVQGVGVFPDSRRPRVIWVGLNDPGGALALLHRAVNEALAQVGFTPETRSFSPHLTLGRVQRRAQPDVLHRIGKAVSQAEVGHLGQEHALDLVLFRSILKPAGAEYSRLATFGLKSMI